MGFTDIQASIGEIFQAVYTGTFSGVSKAKKNVYRQGHGGSQRLEEPGYAFFEHDDTVFDSGGSGFAIEQLQRFIDRFVGQAEGAVVHGNHPPRVEVEKGFGCVRRISVDVTELRRIVCPDREQSELRSKTPSDFRKSGEVRGIAGMIDRMLPRFQNEASIATMGVFQDACAPMP